jgi:predicted RNA-binding protein with PIN domain
MTRWLVDGMNVVGSTPDGWWKDRQGAMRRLAERLAAFARESGDEVTVVFDGKPFQVDTDPVSVRFATRRGRNAADDEIVRIVRDDPDPAGITVVTSDRELVDRVSSHGARVESSRPFLNTIRSVS